MLVIRLFRTGKKNQPFFKIVVTDKRKPPKGGRFVEELGFLDPLKKKKGLKIERIKYWLSKGAKPSDTIYNLLIKEKVLEGKKVPLHKKKKKKDEEKPKEAVKAETKEAKPEGEPEKKEEPKEEKPEEKKEEPKPEKPKEEAKE
jgi:small subunit ribosomal protein S16